MTQEFGACVFDVTLDCEDGAPVGAGPTRQNWWPSQMLPFMAPELIAQPCAAWGCATRWTTRRLPADVRPLWPGTAAATGVPFMIPKVECRADVERPAHALSMPCQAGHGTSSCRC